MIQRKQSLWFLASALVASLAFILPFGVKSTTSLASYTIHDQALTAQSDMILITVFGLIILQNLISIFLFKKRNIQVFLAIDSIMMCIGALAFELYFATQGGNKIVFGMVGTSIYVGLLIPVVSMIFSYMAMQGVKSDVKLLKDTDRLR